jgi:PAS domain S-box-containing protein
VPVWKRSEILSLFLAIVVLTLTTWSAIEDWRQTRLDNSHGQQSRVVLEGVNKLMSSLKDAETGQRGYLLTRNPKYLAPYQSASAEIPTELTRLEKFFPKNPDLVRLRQLVNAKLSELGQAIDLRDTTSFEAALAVVMTDRGQRDMEAIRVLSDHLSSTEYAKLSANSVVVEERIRRAAYIETSGSAVLLGLLILSAFTIHRTGQRQEHLIQRLTEDDRQLRELTQQTQDAETRIRDTLESIADGFISFDRHFNIRYLNSAAEAILGHSRDFLIGKNFWTEFSEHATPDLEARYKQVVLTQTPLNFEVFSAKRNTWREESIYPAKEKGISVYLRDVTERKRLEERNRHTQKLESLGILAGGIAHDFNNLLTAILGGASLLQEELDPDSDAASHLKIVLNASDRAAQLTRQMLAYSGRGRFVIEQLDLAKQVREITELLQSSVTREVELVLNLDTSGALIDADAGQIQSLVMNLVINGAEAIEKGPGTVVVSTRLQELDAEYVRDNMAGDSVLPGAYLLLEVHDTGKGMDLATLDRIFDPFFTTKFTGRGLGLAAVLGIVRGHRGAIKVYSHLEQGTTFKVFFPLSAEMEATPKLLTTPTTLHGHETVLIVDDEDTVQRMASAALAKYGYKILQARNGREAIEIFERNPSGIAIVLLDMTMPVMSGEETLKRLKEIRPDVPVIASSGYNEIEALRRFGQGVRGFLQKPYRAAQLAEKVRGALSHNNSAVT